MLLYVCSPMDITLLKRLIYLAQISSLSMLAFFFLFVLSSMQMISCSLLSNQMPQLENIMPEVECVTTFCFSSLLLTSLVPDVACSFARAKHYNLITHFSSQKGNFGYLRNTDSFSWQNYVGIVALMIRKKASSDLFSFELQGGNFILLEVQGWFQRQ